MNYEALIWSINSCMLIIVTYVLLPWKFVQKTQNVSCYQFLPVKFNNVRYVHIVQQIITTLSSCKIEIVCSLKSFLFLIPFSLW